MKRGVTLIELMVAMVCAAVIATVSAYLFKIAIKTYQYNARQTTALEGFRGALEGRGGWPGFLPGARAAKSVSSLSATSLVAVSTAAVSSTYAVSNGSLYLTKSGTPYRLADSVDSFAVTYYNMNSSGLIIESTAANTASMVTALVTLTGSGGKRTYSTFAGARLRNR